MKEAPKTWRITHYPAGVAPSRDYAVRAPSLDAARRKLAYNTLNVPRWTVRQPDRRNGMDASHPLMPEVARVEVDPHRPTASKCQVGRASSSQANRRVQDED